MEDKYKNFPNEIASLDISSKKDYSEITRICTALANPIRINILNQLQEKHYTIPELAKLNSISINNCVFHTKLLSDAKLIRIELVPGETRNVRTCYRITRKVSINFFNDNSTSNQKIHKHFCRVGEFIDYSADADIRYATNDEAFLSGNPFSRSRFDAELIWSPSGCISYGFPNPSEDKNRISQIDINLELCSETINYDNTYKSDITFWINDKELFTYTSPGDYGDRKGINNPKWWGNNGAQPTQYGNFLHIKITKNCIYLNDLLVNEKFDINSLNLDKNKNIILKLGNKENATYKGGWNIFGKHFGDYPIDIEMEILVDEK